MVDIQKNTQTVQKNLQATQKGNHSSGLPTLIAVSKKQSLKAITAAYHAGLQQFGENYLNEALPKITALSELDITWHFIGAIQSNKCQAIAEHFDWVQSVASKKVVEKLAQAREHMPKPLNILIQVNISNDPNKSGVSLSAARELLEFAQQFQSLTVRGLMTITKQQDRTQLEQDYTSLAQFFASIQQAYQLDTLSMGMSDDYVTALQCGATMVRIGSALFGSRQS